MPDPGPRCVCHRLTRSCQTHHPLRFIKASLHGFVEVADRLEDATLNDHVPAGNIVDVPLARTPVETRLPRPASRTNPRSTTFEPHEIWTTHAGGVWDAQRSSNECLQPAYGGDLVVVEKDDTRPYRLSYASVPSRVLVSWWLPDDAYAWALKPRREMVHGSVSSVGRTVIDHDDLVAVIGIVLINEGLQRPDH
jgi:hypothetical protein